MIVQSDNHRKRPASIFPLSGILFIVYFFISPAYAFQQNSPFYPFIHETDSNKNHYLNVLNIGDEALLARIHLIRNAQQTVDIQTFIWDIDETSRYFVHELIQAAQRGVRVRIMIDYITMPKDPRLYAALITAHPNISLKIYNPLKEEINSSKVSFAIEALKSFRDINQRMHNKVFLVDHQIAVTGGRNYENDYYDRGAHRNFKDRDVLIIGPVVKEMVESFNEYWEHPLSVDIRAMADVQDLLESRDFPVYKGRDSLNLGNFFDEADRCASDAACLKDKFINRHYMVNKVEFFADKPGKVEEQYGEYQVSKTTYELAKLVLSVKRSIVMQTPYLIIGKKGNKFFRDLIKKNPQTEILVSSNSLAAADHVYAYAFSYKNKKKYIKNFRWQIFELRPVPGDADQIIAPVARHVRTDDYSICIHAKTYVVDHEKVWVGSFNLDPRSVNLNTEVGVIIYDSQLARDIENDIRRDMSNENSWTIAKRKKRPLRSFISGTIGTMVEAIPIINVWPFTYSGSYELIPGKTPLSIFDVDFHDHYRYIGPFPEVEGTGKEVEARMMKAFLGPMEPLL